MTHWITKKWNLLALVLLALVAGTSRGQEIGGPKKPDRIVPYKTVGDVELSLHVFEPSEHASTDRRPAIVFFFGGGWVGGTPSQFYPQSRYLASRGMVAICAEYRTKSKHSTSPKACVRDGKSAMRWVRRHADDLGIDPDRLAAGGGSAGGHVAAATATLDGFDEAGEDTTVSCRPDALVLFNPVYDNGPSGYGHDRVEAYWCAFSPMHNLSEDAPPTIVFLGTEDDLVPVATAEEYKRSMEEFGRRCDLYLYEGAAHGFFNRGDAFEDTLFETDQFLASLGYLSGEPTLQRSVEKRKTED